MGRACVFISSRDGKGGHHEAAGRRKRDPPKVLDVARKYEPFEARTLSRPAVDRLSHCSGLEISARHPCMIPVNDTKHKFIPLVTGPYTESMPRLSPDGHWLMYQSNETGRFEVYVRPFPNNGAHVQVSDNGGTEALWARDGHALFYRGPSNEIIKVDVNTAGVISLGKHAIVMTGDYLTDSSHPNWDIAPGMGACPSC